MLELLNDAAEAPAGRWQRWRSRGAGWLQWWRSGAAGRWHATRRMAARTPHPGISDLIELAGVALVAVALSYVHVGLGIGAVGAYLIIVGNERG